MYDVDIIIPTYKPDDRFLESLRRLSKQSVKPNNIRIGLYGTDLIWIIK